MVNNPYTINSIEKILKKIAVIGSWDAIRLLALPRKYWHWNDDGRRVPSIKKTIDDFVREKLLKSRPINGLYTKVSCMDGELENNEIAIPKCLAEKCWCITFDFDETHYLVKNLDTKKLEIITRGKLSDKYKKLLPLRRPKSGDSAIVIRHPVKEWHTVLGAKIRIIDKESSTVYVNKNFISEIEGDFDGDQLGVFFFSESVIEPDEIPDKENRKIEIPAPGKATHMVWRPKTVSKLLKFENPENFVMAVLEYTLEIVLDKELIKDHIKNYRFGELLNNLAAIPVVDKAIKFNDKSVIQILREIWPESTWPEMLEKQLTEEKYLNYDKEISKGLEIEKLFRVYFRGYGPRFSGYVQKVLLDIQSVILEYKEYFKDLFSDEEFEMLETLEFLKVIDRLQQKVIDLKHRKHSLSNLDLAKKLDDTTKKKMTIEEIYNICYEITEDKKISELTAKMLWLAFQKNHLLLTWSHSLAPKLIEGRLLRTWMTEPVLKLVQDE